MRAGEEINIEDPQTLEALRDVGQDPEMLRILRDGDLLVDNTVARCGRVLDDTFQDSTISPANLQRLRMSVDLLGTTLNHVAVQYAKTERDLKAAQERTSNIKFQREQLHVDFNDTILGAMVGFNHVWLNRETRPQLESALFALMASTQRAALRGETIWEEPVEIRSASANRSHTIDELWDKFLKGLFWRVPQNA